jgi:hypothetical protein
MQCKTAVRSEWWCGGCSGKQKGREWWACWRRATGRALWTASRRSRGRRPWQSYFDSLPQPEDSKSQRLTRDHHRDSCSVVQSDAPRAARLRCCLHMEDHPPRSHTHTHTHTHTHVASGHLTSTLQKLTMRVMCTLMLRDVKSLTLPCDSISKTLIYSPLE